MSLAASQGPAPFHIVHRPDLPTDPLRGAVIIVIYNRADDLAGCLRSLRRHLPAAIAVVVVDNASREALCPPLVPEFPEVHFLRAAGNRGYAGGNNLGADYALGLGAPLLYFLNDDTEVLPRFWEECEAAVCDQDVTLAGSILVNFDAPDIMQNAGAHYNLRDLTEWDRGANTPYAPEYAVRYDCEAVWGAAFMMRATRFAQLGGFDESYFHLSEDIDLCLRVRAIGGPVACIGSSVVKHKGGGSLAYANPRYVYWLFRNRYWLFARLTPAPTFWRFAPRRAARQLLDIWQRKTPHPRNHRVLVAAMRGILVGFLWRPRRRMYRFSDPAGRPSGSDR